MQKITLTSTITRPLQSKKRKMMMISEIMRMDLGNQIRRKKRKMKMLRNYLRMKVKKKNFELF